MREAMTMPSVRASVSNLLSLLHTHFFTRDPLAWAPPVQQAVRDAGLGMMHPGRGPRPVTCQQSCA